MLFLKPVFRRSCLHLVLCASMVFSGVPLGASERSMTSANSQNSHTNYLSMVVDRQPGLSPRNLVLISKEITALYEKETLVLEGKEADRFNLSCEQCPLTSAHFNTARKNMSSDFIGVGDKNIIVTGSGGETRHIPIKFHMRDVRSQFKEKRNQIQKSDLKARLAIEVVDAANKAQIAFVESVPVPGSSMAGFVMSEANDIGISLLHKAADNALRESNLENLKFILDQGKVTREKILECSGIQSSQFLDCASSSMAVAIEDLTAIAGTPEALAEYLQGQFKIVAEDHVKLTKVTSRVSANIDRIDEFEKRFNKVKDLTEAVRQFSEENRSLVVSLHSDVVAVKDVVSGLIQDVRKNTGNIAKNKKDIAALNALMFEEGGFETKLALLSKVFPDTSERAEAKQKILDAKERSETLEKIEKIGEVGGNIITIAKGLRNIGVPIDGEVIEVAEKGLKIGLSVAAAVGGGPVGWIGAAASILSVFGGGGDDPARKRHEAIMGRFDIVIDNQQIILENQELILNAVHDVAKDIMDLTIEHHLKELSILGELKTVTVANNVALSLQATEGLSRCEAFRSGMRYWNQRVDLTPLERLNQHYKDYFIDYRSCVRDLLKFVSYNKIDYKFNRWYFLSNLADVKSNGSSVVDISVLEAIAELYSFMLNHYSAEEGLKYQGLMTLPSDNLLSVNQKLATLGKSEVVERLEDVVGESAFQSNFPNYIAPGLAKRVGRNFFDLYHYWELLSDPDNQSELNSFDQITSRLEPSRRAFELLTQVRDIVDVAIAQQTMLSGDVLLKKLESHFSPSYTVPNFQVGDVLSGIAQSQLIDLQGDVHSIVSKHLVVLNNVIRARVYKRFGKHNHVTYSYAYLNHDASMMRKIIDSGFEYRKVFVGDEPSWEVKYSYFNSGTPSDPKNREIWVKLPTPAAFLEKRLLVTPDLEELIAIRNGLQEEIFDFQTYMEADTEIERKGYLFSILSSVN